MKIISKSERITNVTRTRSFHWNDCPGAGFSFDVDEHGGIIITDGNRENAEGCLTGRFDVTDEGIVEYSNTYRQCAVGECEVCKQEVYLEGFTNACQCGADYNSSGQRLASRSQWGADTGESLSDILRIA